MTRLLLVAFASVLLASALFCQTAKDASQPKGPEPFLFGNLGLKVDLAAFADVKFVKPKEKGTHALWTAKVGEYDMVLRLATYELSDKKRCYEPGGVFYTYAEQHRRSQVQLSHGQFRDRRVVNGKFGIDSFALVGSAPNNSRKRKGRVFVLASTLKDQGYFVDISCRGEPSKALRADILSRLEKAVSFTGTPRDPKWSDAEARALWDKWVPDGCGGKLVVRRTKHFLVLSDVTRSKMIKKLEAYYKQVKKVVPFEEQPSQRLIPVIVLDSRDDFKAFASFELGVEKHLTDGVPGHVGAGYFITWESQPYDWVGASAVTVLLLNSRLNYQGSGAWLQQGLGELVGRRAKDIKKQVKENIKAKKVYPLARFLVWPTLDKESRAGARVAYDQAGAFMLFLSKKHKKKFKELVRRMGCVILPVREDIDQVFQEVLGKSIGDLDTAWKKYFR